MFNTLKQTLLEDIKVEVTEAKAMLDEIQSLENDIKRLESHANPSEKYTFFEKIFTNRTRYKSAEAKYIEDQKQLKIAVERVKELRGKKDPEKLREIIDRYNKIRDAKSIDELGFTFEEAMNFLKEKGIPLVLDQDDIIQKNEAGFDKLDDFVLVHKTSYVPSGDVIKTTGNSGATKKQQIQIGDKMLDIEYALPRQTVHFAVNGEVKSHEKGNWDDTKYAIIIPLVDVPNVTQFRVEDTFTTGDVDISKGYLLCPEGEVEQIKEKNPNLTVFGYKNSVISPRTGEPTVSGYANKLLSKLGYKYEEIASGYGVRPGWANRKDEEKANITIRGNTDFDSLGHNDSLEGIEEEYNIDLNQYKAVIDKLFGSDIDFEPSEVTSQLSEQLLITKNLSNSERSKIFLYENSKFMHKTVSELWQYGIEIPSYFEDLAKASNERKDVDYAFERAASFGAQISDDTKKYVEKMKQRDGNKFSPSSCLSELFVYETLKQIKKLKQTNVNQQESAITL